MIRLAISVEGSTEREFASRVLVPHFSQMGFAVAKAIPLGGGVNMARVRDEARTLLKNFSHVSTLFDLYGFQGREGVTAETLEERLNNAVASDRFIPYVQQYEFEALLFSDPVATANRLGAANKSRELERIVKECGGPELVNDGFDTCPSRRLRRIFPAFDKKLHGPAICQDIGLPAIRGACARFNVWLNALERLVASAP